MPINNTVSFDDFKKKRMMTNPYPGTMPQPPMQGNIGAPTMPTAPAPTAPTAPTATGMGNLQPSSIPSPVRPSTGIARPTQSPWITSQTPGNPQTPSAIPKPMAPQPAKVEALPDATPATQVSSQIIPPAGLQQPAAKVATSSAIIPAQPTGDGIGRGTEAQSILDEQVIKTASGEGPEVTAARHRLDREKTLNLDKAQRDSHNMAIQAGYRPGTAQYDAIVRKGIADARNANIRAENEFNQFAMGARRDTWSELAAMDTRDWSRLKENEGDARLMVDRLMANIPSNAGRELVAFTEFSGGNVIDILDTLRDPATGEWNVKDPTKLELAQKTFRESLDTMTVDPRTRDLWASPEAKEEYAAATWSQMQENVFNPITTQGERKDFEGETRTSLDSAVKSGDYSSLSSGQWDEIMQNPTLKKQFEDSVESFSLNDEQLSIGNWDSWEKLNLNADEVDIAHGSGSRADQQKFNDENSAGSGKGSVIMYNGRPMRITLYNSQWADKSLGDERKEVIKGQYLDGAGEEVQIGGRDWHSL